MHVERRLFGAQSAPARIGRARAQAMAKTAESLVTLLV
jgi:hypothetical protein